VRPAAVGAGATGSLFTVAARFVATTAAFAAGALRAGAAFLVPDFVTIVVPALVELPSLSLPLPDGAADSAVAGRLVCLLGAREDGFRDAGFAGLLDDFTAIDDAFSTKDDFAGDRGGARGL
jgi:hypothetical protein